MKSIDCCFLRWHILAHTHTCEVVLIYLYPVFEPLFSFWFVSGSFTLIHVIYQSSALSLSFWTGKKQGAPENRNKGNPPPPLSLPIQRQVLESRVNLTHSPLSLSLAFSHAVALTLFLLNLWELLPVLLYLWKSATLICCRAEPYPILHLNH